MREKLITSLLVIGLTVLSGLGDSQGFIHAALVWKSGKLVLSEIAKSALGFLWGIIIYWVTIKYLQEIGIFSAELQTILWFGVTIIGVAIASGEFLKWQFADQVVAVMVLAGIGWLLFRNG